MLTKKQLEDAAECLARFHERTCGQCSCNKFRYGYVGSYGCTENAAKTALAYREMLERACVILNDHFCGDEHYSGIGEMEEVRKVLNEWNEL